MDYPGYPPRGDLAPRGSDYLRQGGSEDIRSYSVAAPGTLPEYYQIFRRYKWTVVLIALAGALSAFAGNDPVIDPDVRAAVRTGPVRVLVDLRVTAADPSSIGSAQDEALRRLAGTGARLARRYSSAPLLALEIDALALSRLEAMPDIIARVRMDRIIPFDEGRSRRP